MPHPAGWADADVKSILEALEKDCGATLRQVPLFPATQLSNQAGQKLLPGLILSFLPSRDKIPAPRGGNGSLFPVY